MLESITLAVLLPQIADTTALRDRMVELGKLATTPAAKSLVSRRASALSDELFNLHRIRIQLAPELEYAA